jgi:choline dehydrogenase-like flavoprotein
MGWSARETIVDRNCRVRGDDNFFIAASSVFQSGGFVNPTLTIVALGAWLADTISRRG